MAFIKDFVCRSCGSTLGRWSKNSETGRSDKMCFCCGIGDFELSDYEIEVLDYPSALEAIGREYGHCSKIYPRINTVASRLSRRSSSSRAQDSLFYIVRDTSFLTLDDIQTVAEVGKKVIEGMEEMIEENKNKEKLDE